MKTNKKLKLTIALALLLLMPLTGSAESNNRDDRRKGPPPEAIAACEGKSVGDSVTFTGRRGESLTATCREIEGQLAAVPEGKPPGGGRPQ